MVKEDLIKQLEKFSLADAETSSIDIEGDNLNPGFDECHAFMFKFVVRGLDQCFWLQSCHGRVLEVW